MSAKQETANTLEALTAQILAMDPSDKEAIMEVGTILEPLPESLPAGSEEVEGLLTLVLEALQALYEETVSNASAAASAVANAVEAARAHLADEADESNDSVRQTSDVLQQILEQSARNDETNAEADTPEPQPVQNPEVQPEVQEVRNDVDTDDSQEPTETVDDGQAVLPLDADPELMGEFIIECVDHITAAEAALLNLESNPDDTEEINVVFRAFHTIKGTSGFLGLPHTQTLAHLARISHRS